MANEVTDLISGAAQGATTGSALGPWGALAGVGVGLLKTGYGIAQANKAKKLAAANVRPTYQIPHEISHNLDDAQRMALGGLPDEQKQQFVNNVQRSQQFGLQGLSDRKAGIAGLGTLVQNSNDAYNNLLGQDAAARNKNQMLLMQNRSTMAGYKDKAFDINQMTPYAERATASTAMQGAGLQNIYGGLTDVAQGALRTPGFGGGQKGLGTNQADPMVGGMHESSHY